MKNLFVAIIVFPCVIFAGMRYDKATQTWYSVPDNPELLINANANELQMKKRIEALRKARKEAAAKTNTVYVIVRPGDIRVKGKRVFSKMKLVSALMRIDKWHEVKQWIDVSGLTDLYLAAQDVREDNEYFVQGMNALKNQLNLTDAQIEEILSACIAE